jgi:hypothetical protein
MGSTRGGGCHHQQTRGRWGERRRVAWRADGMAERSGGAAMGAANAACADTERVSEQVLPHEAGQCDSGLLSAARGLRQREDRAHCVVPPGFKVRNTKFEVKLISHGNSPTKFEVKLISHGNSPTSSTKFEVKLISHRNPPTSSTKYKTLRTADSRRARVGGAASRRAPSATCATATGRGPRGARRETRSIGDTGFNQSISNLLNAAGARRAPPRNNTPLTPRPQASRCGLPHTLERPLQSQVHKPMSA